MRPTLYGSRHAVSAGHYLAAAAAFSILESGGNAVDAGCCAGIALAVLHPDEVNFAGVAPIMIRTGEGKIVTIAGLGYWPKTIPKDLFMREYNGTQPLGVLRTVVPAAPDAWITALRDFGTMSFGDVAAAAIRFAKEGFAVGEFLANQFSLHEEDYRRWPTNAKLFQPQGRAVRLNERFVQTDLAATIQYMVDEERAALTNGRDAALEAARAAFYTGDIAVRIAKHQEEEGGYLSFEDLATFHSRYEDPVITRWRDFQVITCGPWCQGPMLAQALLMVERAGLDDLKHNEPAYIHLITEILKGAFADREYHYGDPLFVDVGLKTLLSAKHIEKRVAGIDLKAAMPDMPPNLYHNSEIPKAATTPSERDPDTSYLCVVDRWGNAFSATPSDASWRAPVVPGLGIVPSGRGTQSRPDPNHPSGVAPGKRPRLTPNPAILLRDDGSVMPFGAPGGDSQVQAMLQVVLNAFHFGMDIQEAIDAPRFISMSFPNSFAPYNHYPGLLGLEDRFPSSTVDELVTLGHKIENFPAYSRRLAAVEAVLYQPDTGFFRSGADPRQLAYAITV